MAGLSGFLGCSCCTRPYRKQNVRWASAKPVYTHLQCNVTPCYEKDLTGNIRTFVKYWKPQQLVPETASEATKLIRVSSSGKKYMSADSGWFAKYINWEIGVIKNCYIAINEKKSTVFLLGTPENDLAYGQDDR